MLSVNHLVGFGAVARTPTPGGDEYWDYVVSLLHFNGSDASTTFTDETGKIWTAKGNAQIDTAQSVYGAASGLFDSSGDGITTPDSEAFNFGAGNFTLEWRARLVSVTGDYGLYGQHINTSAADSSLTFRYSSSNGGLRVALYSGAAATTHNFTWSPSINTWYAIALVRNGSTVSCYVDGVKIGSDLTFSSTLNNSTQVVALGCINNAPDYPLNGWLDEVRITNGVARYTANYTPAAAEFPNYY